MGEAGAVKTLRLRYRGRCAGCAATLEAGTTAHYLTGSKTGRCLPCGPSQATPPTTAPAAPAGPDAFVLPPGAFYPEPVPDPPLPTAAAPADGPELTELTERVLPSQAACGDCGRTLRRGSDAVCDPVGTVVWCLECVTLDTVHVLGNPGEGARREHAERLDRHQARVRARHPRLGPVMLTLSDDPSQVTAWAKGAAGEEQLGRGLSKLAGEHVKVLHDRKLPGSSANVDHLVVTPAGVWVIDAKRYRDKKVETRGGGRLSRRPAELHVGGSNQHKLVHGVHRQVSTVQAALAAGGRAVPVHGALVFIDADIGLFDRPFTLEGVWIGWGRAIRKRLEQDAGGGLPVAEIAKLLAARLRPG